MLPYGFLEQRRVNVLYGAPKNMEIQLLNLAFARSITSLHQIPFSLDFGSRNTALVEIIPTSGRKGDVGCLPQITDGQKEAVRKV